MIWVLLSAGKSLVLAQLLFGGAEAEAPAAAGPEAQEAQAPLPGSLACNELDPGRRRRLLGVLKEYLPEAVRQYIRCEEYCTGLLAAGTRFAPCPLQIAQ